MSTEISNQDDNFILTQAQCDFLAKSFHKYDTEENGKITLEDAVRLVQDILGPEIHTSEFQAIRLKGEGMLQDGLLSFSDFTELMRDHMSSTTRWGGLKTKIHVRYRVE